MKKTRQSHDSCIFTVICLTKKEKHNEQQCSDSDSRFHSSNVSDLRITHRDLTSGLCPSGSLRSLALNVSATCASRPCFPGVQCINRRPPHVGYVCGRCPPGLYGNGRVCMKSAKAGTDVCLINMQILCGWFCCCCRFPDALCFLRFDGTLLIGE